MTREQVEGIVRGLLTTFGGVLVTKGSVDANTLQLAIGALSTLAGIGWSVWSNSPKRIEVIKK